MKSKSNLDSHNKMGEEEKMKSLHDNQNAQLKLFSSWLTV